MRLKVSQIVRQYIYSLPLFFSKEKDNKNNNENVIYFVALKPESQNFLDPGLAKPQSQLNLGFKDIDLDYFFKTTLTQGFYSTQFYYFVIPAFKFHIEFCLDKQKSKK